MTKARSAFALWIAVSLVLSFTGHALPAPDARIGVELAATCAACHRLDGHSKGLPPVVGISAEDLARKMQAFKSDEGSSHIMHAVSLSLSEDEIKAVALYLAEAGKDSIQP